jgi:transposase InsO family protein
MDFITDLHESDGKTTILVVTDRLTREVIFEGMAETDSEQIAWALVRRVISKHGFPRSIVSDRGPQFVSLVWSRICALVGIQKRLSTAYHPQTDGATERINSTVEA